ncbi:glycosyltransferase [Vibrio fluvialis]|nr:glycosyltransferase [Vibrio fluvialis]
MSYDFIFFTHLPSFYKVNLYNELVKQGYSVLAVFVSDSSSIREGDFVANESNMKFDTIFLNKSKPFEKRNTLLSCIRLMFRCRTISSKVIVSGGWDLPEFWVASLFFVRSNKSVAVESTIFEHQKSNVIKKFLKKVFLSLQDFALPSGKLHEELIRLCGFKGGSIFTHGVGLINHVESRRDFVREPASNPLKVLYVGRLSHEKNLSFLINNCIHREDISLTIVGSGPDESLLKSQSSSLVTFLGHLPNSQVLDVIKKSDLLVLPSISEPWGLVVDEAIALGVPCLLSECVGSSHYFVDENKLGLTFDPTDSESFMCTLNEYIKRRREFEVNVDNFNYMNIVENQVRSYSDLIKWVN